jgi:hypothetical protein
MAQFTMPKAVLYMAIILTLVAANGYFPCEFPLYRKSAPFSLNAMVMAHVENLIAYLCAALQPPANK